MYPSLTSGIYDLLIADNQHNWYIGMLLKRAKSELWLCMEYPPRHARYKWSFSVNIFVS